MAESVRVTALTELRSQYQRELFEEFLPFMDRRVIDQEYGGFLCNVDLTGRRISTEKQALLEGRGTWVYSFLYNKLAPDPKYLEAARRSVAGLLRLRPAEGQSWPAAFSRTWEPSGGAGGLGTDLFIAEGLAEYSLAAKDEQCWALAKDVLLSGLRRYDETDYHCDVFYGPSVSAPPRAPRTLGYWFLHLRLATQLLLVEPDLAVQRVADRCIDAVMNYHYNPDFDLLNEVLNHDLSRPRDAFGQFVYCAHAIEVLWMILDEAVRRKDQALYQLAAARLKRHIEVSWDDVYGGARRCLLNVDENLWQWDKALWVQEEVLVATLLVCEWTGDEWAWDWFTRMHQYTRSRFPLGCLGSPMWIFRADRKVTWDEKANQWVELYHHARHFMLNLLSVEHLLARHGAPSNPF